MQAFSDYVGPLLFNGGDAADYCVEVLKNGGLGTRHIPTGKVVPHVLSKVPESVLNQNLPNQVPQMPMSAGHPYLQIAQLGVSVLNLAVSAWTAWKVHKIDKKVDSILLGVGVVDKKIDGLGEMLGASVEHLDGLIRNNALMLGLVIENQGNIGRGIAVLQQQVAEGFQSVHLALQSAEARAEARELEQQMRLLYKHYQTCAEAMALGDAPPQHDLRRIVDVAAQVIAWLETRIQELNTGSPKRLPLFTAYAIALRLEIESRTLLEDSPGYAQRVFTKLSTEIRRELDVLTHDAQVYALAEERPALISQYVFLNRALKSSATMIEFDDGRMLPYYPSATLEWDDGFDRVREILSHEAGTPTPARIELQTLEDHAAWEKLSNWPSGSTEVEIQTSDLASLLGLPDDRHVAESQMLELLRVGPRAANDARIKIAKEWA
ncbi:conserved protein of unknown function [Burkholderia multivorans]